MFVYLQFSQSMNHEKYENHLDLRCINNEINSCLIRRINNYVT